MIAATQKESEGPRIAPFPAAATDSIGCVGVRISASSRAGTSVGRSIPAEAMTGRIVGGGAGCVAPCMMSSIWFG